jgi:hypothetical protein
VDFLSGCPEGLLGVENVAVNIACGLGCCPSWCPPPPYTLPPHTHVPVPWCWQAKDQGSLWPHYPLVAGNAVQSLSITASYAAGMPVAHSGQTVPGQAPLCFDPGSPASDRTEGKKKGRPKAENQALRDIPVSSLRAGVGLVLGQPVDLWRPLSYSNLPSILC